MYKVGFSCHLDIKTSQLIRCQQFVCSSGFDINRSGYSYDYYQLKQVEEVCLKQNGSNEWVIGAEEEHEYTQ